MTERERLEEIARTFRAPGWKLLITELVEYRDAINRVDALNNEADLQFRRGQLLELDKFINTEAATRRMIESLRLEND